MEGAAGKDKFEGTFDFFEWSAPYFLTPKEVVGALNATDFKGKKVSAINIIGIAVAENSFLLAKKLKEAGIELQDGWLKTYPHIDDVLVPCEVEACEPVQFVFDDDTTLEILPISDDGARISTNSIPIGLTNGLNRSNFDASCLFAEALGKELRSIEMRVEKTIKQYIDERTPDREEPLQEVRTEYRFCFRFDHPIIIELTQSWESTYTIRLHGFEQYDQVPYSRMKAAVKETGQVCIINGRDSGRQFWITPFCSDEKEDEEQFYVDNYGISVDDDAMDYLEEFLYKYFDPSIQEGSGDYSEDGKRIFDWFGINIYSFESMKKMLDDIASALALLETDYDNPLISDVKSHFHWCHYTSKRREELSEAEINTLSKNDVPAAVDFYKRFIKRMTSMMNLPGNDRMSFAGP